MRSIKRNLTKEEIIRFYDSDDFWSNVEVNSIFLKWLDDDSLFKSYNWICFTKGTVKNLQRKYEFLQKVFQEYGRGNFLSYIGIHDSEKKTNLRMFDGIQIDDRIDNLANSDARLKILVKNHLDTNYNSKIEEQEILGNLYVTNDLSDVEDILRFNLINKL